MVHAVDDYYRVRLTNTRHKVSDVFYSKVDKRVYFTLGNVYLFYTEDNFATIKEVSEVNEYYNAIPIGASNQKIVQMTESVDGTLILIAKDFRKPAPASSSDYDATEKGVVWRKPKGTTPFTRTVVNDPAWNIHENGNISSGYFGVNHIKMVAFTSYDQILNYSLDDGLTWLSQDFTAYSHHLHGVYLPKYEFGGHKAKMWLAIGDDFTGQIAGIMHLDTLNGDNTMAGHTWAFRERPGYRLVGITGTRKRMYFGGESSAGGILSISNDDYSIANNLWEYKLGRNRMDFHQFRSLLVTDDGLLFSVTDSYAAANTPHKNQGGYAYLSQDDGATFVEFPINGGRFTRGAAYNGDYFYFGSNEVDSEKTNSPMIMYQLAKPTTVLPPNKYIVKSIYVSNDAGTVKLPGNGVSIMVDLAAYTQIKVSIETATAGRIKIQAAPFYVDPAWTPQGDIKGWQDITSVSFSGAERKDIILPKESCYNRLFRVVNATGTEIQFKHLMFIGQN